MSDIDELIDDLVRAAQQVVTTQEWGGNTQSAERWQTKCEDAIRTAYIALSAENVRLRTALKACEFTLAMFVGDHPKWLYNGVLQDPNGVHEALRLVRQCIDEQSATAPQRSVDRPPSTSP